jgi:hypothetical protein
MGLWVFGVAVAAVLAATVTCLLAVRSSRHNRAELERQLAATRDDLAALTAQIEALTTEVVEARRVADAQVSPTESAPFVITGVVAAHEEHVVQREAQIVRAIETSRPVWLPAKPVREALVKTVALGHGVRRALSPEKRDRIVLEMRAEVRRSRRQRKAEMKALRKYLRDRRRSAA